MAYRRVQVAPVTAIAEERRGTVKGRFCTGCGAVFALYTARHHGKPIDGKDHIAAPCSHEGEEFEDGAAWWEPAIEVLPAPSAD